MWLSCRSRYLDIYPLSCFLQYVNFHIFRSLNDHSYVTQSKRFYKAIYLTLSAPQHCKCIPFLMIKETKNHTYTNRYS
jgi:hypothetical protein